LQKNEEYPDQSAHAPGYFRSVFEFFPVTFSHAMKLQPCEGLSSGLSSIFLRMVCNLNGSPLHNNAHAPHLADKSRDHAGPVPYAGFQKILFVVVGSKNASSMQLVSNQAQRF